MEAEINFDEASHRYWSKRNSKTIEYTSATTLLKEYVPEFDTQEVLRRLTMAASDDPEHRYFALSKQEILDQWEHKSEVACIRGTIFHKTVEAHLCKEAEYLQGKRKTKPNKLPATIKNTASTSIDLKACWEGFLNFRSHFPWRLYSSEEVFFLDEDEIAGTPDAIFHDPNDPEGYIVVDWKTSKPLVSQFKNPKFKEYFTHPAIAHIPTLNYWVYALQVNLYAYMINKRKGLKITEMVILRFGEDCGEYGFNYYRMPDLQKEIGELLAARREEKILAAKKHEQEKS